MVNKKFIFVAGAPRCGTTALFQYLNEHPAICGSEHKETCYFIDDDYFTNFYNQKQLPTYSNYGLIGYADHFKSGINNKNVKVFLDASPDYLYQKTFIEVISNFHKKPTLVFVLRKPSERIYSLFNFAKSRLARIPKNKSFKQFVEELKGDDSIYKNYPNIRYSLDHSNYQKYLRPFFEVLGEDNILIFTYEEFIKDPLIFISKILKSVDLSSVEINQNNFEVKNQSYALKFPFLQKFYNRLPLPNSIRFGNSKIKEKIKSVYLKLNTEKYKTSSEDLDVKLELEQLFIDNNKLLHSEYNVNIDAW